MLFNAEEEARITAAIRAAEQRTSGEIRLFVEDFCDRDHPVERAAELFQRFGMYNTRQRNAVLLYIAEKSHHFAIWGDAGIHERVGLTFWEAEKQLLRHYLQRGEACEGVCRVIEQIGEKLREYFPADPSQNENELPDDILYGGR
ncbi:MAG: TPM domain-containing protein [Saprospiraceae bacterium]|nr:TPM domain-containing protein [Saprospiraceae bacterium]MDW8483320.1 TPM domain-containing protein [Saprospiraceae bacterium]